MDGRRKEELVLFAGPNSSVSVSSTRYEFSSRQVSHFEGSSCLVFGVGPTVPVLSSIAHRPFKSSNDALCLVLISGNWSDEDENGGFQESLVLNGSVTTGKLLQTGARDRRNTLKIYGARRLCNNLGRFPPF